jgi:hypothetical protein
MASLTNCLRTVLFLLPVTLGRWAPARRWHMARFLLHVTPARWVPGRLMVRFLLRVTPARWVRARRSYIRWSVSKHNLISLRLMIPGDRVLKLEPGNVT